MATSPIYGWAEPDNTDLVKNGALAIRTLGNAIDTTMGTMVAKTIIDAKGDLIAGSAADTALRLAVGNNGETLVADSSTSTGLRYTAGTVQSNPVINSAFQVWQRGTSFSLAASTAYTSGFIADRWQTATGANQACTISRQATGDTTNLPNIQYALRHQRNSGQTGTGAITLLQNFETINSIPFAGKTVTFSFYARAGANFSAASSLLTPYLQYGTGTDQNIFSGFTGQTTAVTGSATLTTTWQRFSYSGTIPATATQIATFFNYTPVGTAGAADYYDITGVQIDIGSVALPFRTYAGTIQGELAAAQRYYYRIQNDASTSYSVMGAAYTTGGALLTVPLKSTMRVAPTAVDYSSLRLYDLVNAASTVTALTLDTGSPNMAIIAVSATGLTQYRSYFLLGNTVPSYVGFSAEL